MKSTNNEQEKSSSAPQGKHYIVIGCDIDGCMDSLFLQSMLQQRDDKILSVFRTIINDCGYAQPDRVIIQLATNRKDSINDQVNADRNQTMLAAEVIHSIGSSLSHCGEAWADAVEVNSQLHADQLFPRISPVSNYDECLAQIPSPAHDADAESSSSQTQLHPKEEHIEDTDAQIGQHSVFALPKRARAYQLFAGTQPAGRQKIDVVITLAAQYAACDAQVTIVFCDDRFFLDVDSTNPQLYDMVNFLTENPQWIPQNVTYRFYQLDGSELDDLVSQPSQSAERYATIALGTLGEQTAIELYGLVYNQLSPEDQVFSDETLSHNDHKTVLSMLIASKTKCSGQEVSTAQSVARYCCDWLMTPLRNVDFKICNLAWQEELWNAWSASQKDDVIKAIFWHVRTISGSGSYKIDITEQAFWHEILIPAAESFNAHTATDQLSTLKV